MKIQYEWLGHRLTHDLRDSEQPVKCDSCSVPYVIAQLVEVMAEHRIQEMFVDGQWIKEV